MAMIRCKANLHFYNEAKHTSCPDCERLQGLPHPASRPVEQGETDDASSAPTIMMDSELKRPPIAQQVSGDRDTTEQVPRESATEQTPIDQSAQTELYTDTAATGLTKESPATEPQHDQDAKTELYGSEQAPIVAKESVPKELPTEERAPTDSFTAESTPAPTKVTVMLVEEDKHVSPVVGWLVCTEGPTRGMDYRIRTGINEIAREEQPEVDIVIKGDSLISPRYHAEIQYDSEENVFFLIQKKNQAVMINDVRVRRPTQLNPYDIVQFGQTKLVFVPLCSEKFRWPNDR